jgi:outer membrane protein TolC
LVRRAHRIAVKSGFTILAFIVASLATVLSVRADVATVALPDFEKGASSALALAAAAAAIDERGADLDVARDESGASYTAGAGVGPHRDIVVDGLAREYVRFDQALGVSFPILGKLALQQQDIQNAAIAKKLADLDYRGAQLQLIANVRSSYIDYWAAERSEDISNAFLRDLADDQSAANAYSRNGFWTSADMLRYRSLIVDGQTEVAQAQANEKIALSQLGLATNSTVGAFRSVEPQFAGCSASASDASPLAINNDVPLAELLAQQQSEETILGLQRYMGYDASVNLGGGIGEEQPGGFEYGVVLGATVALPIHVKRLQADQIRSIQAKIRQYDLLAKERREEIGVDVESAVDQRDQASKALESSRALETALNEAVKEARVRLSYIAPDTLAEIQIQEQTAYKARLATVADEAVVLQRLNDLLQLAPDACGAAR